MLAQVQFPFLSFENACCEKRRVLKKHKYPSTPSFYVLLYGHRFIKVKAFCSIWEISPECPPCLKGSASVSSEHPLMRVMLCWWRRFSQPLLWMAVSRGGIAFWVGCVHNNSRGQPIRKQFWTIGQVLFFYIFYFFSEKSHVSLLSPHTE